MDNKKDLFVITRPDAEALLMFLSDLNIPLKTIPRLMGIIQNLKKIDDYVSQGEVEDGNI